MVTVLFVLIVAEVVVYYVKPRVPPILVQLLHIATIVVALHRLFTLVGSL